MFTTSRPRLCKTYVFVPLLMSIILLLLYVRLPRPASRNLILVTLEEQTFTYPESIDNISDEVDVIATRQPQWDQGPLLPRIAFLSESTPHCKNATIIFLVILKKALQDHMTTGCESEGHRTEDITVRMFIQYRWVQNIRPFLTHTEGVVTCCNLPIPHNGSSMFVLYQDKMGREQKAQTERGLYIPPGQLSLNDKQTTKSIVVCVSVYSKPPWLRQWLLYQKTIGVDHIYMYAQQSFIDEGNANDAILQQYLDTNYTTLDVWPIHLNKSQIHHYQQILFYNDCIYRHRETYDYALLYDTDDFFVPVVPGKPDIHYYVQRFFDSSRRIGSINFLWSLYHPDCGLTHDPNTIKDGNVTRYLVNKIIDSNDQYNFKSLHKLSAVREVGVHEAVALVRGYKAKLVPTTDAYVAHIRRNTLKTHPNVCNNTIV